jgi:hypothetical protein
MLTVEKCKNLRDWGFGQTIKVAEYYYDISDGESKLERNIGVDGELILEENGVIMDNEERNDVRIFACDEEGCQVRDWEGRSEIEIDALYNLCEKICGGE